MGGKKVFVYEQETGNLYEDKDGEIVCIGTCYSGKGTKKNKPEFQYKENGVIWEDLFEIGPPEDGSRKKIGPHVMHLKPLLSGIPEERSGNFYIHGDNAANDASRGCIVANREIRNYIGNHPKSLLRVVKNDAASYFRTKRLPELNIFSPLPSIGSSSRDYTPPSAASSRGTEFSSMSSSSSWSPTYSSPSNAWEWTQEHVRITGPARNPGISVSIPIPCSIM